MNVFTTKGGTPTWLLAIIFTIVGVFSYINSVDAATITAFVRDDCKHCQEEKAFFKDTFFEREDIDILYYDITEEKNLKMFNQVAEQYSLLKGTPITMVNGTLLQGFDRADTTGDVILKLLENEDPGLLFEDVLNGGAMVHDIVALDTVCTEESCEDIAFITYEVSLPFIGTTIDIGKFSLTGMSLILGLVDGFNPCALWVLIMFLLILSQLKSRKRMWQYAGLFIIAEAVMYYLILNVWFTAWDFIGLNKIVTPLVGFLALGSGIYFLWKFANFKPECNVASFEQQSKISKKVKELAAKPMTFGVALGILGLAFSVNVFEFACSIGIPQTFTKILDINHLSTWGNQWYMFLYILMYMFDDVIVFGIALYSIEKIGVTHKYSKWTTLIGGLLMLLLGIIMLTRPETLIF